jgi:methionyl-tRNA formyltransferase
MRIAFAGTAHLAALVFDRLLAGRHQVVVCLTAPDRPRGRHGTPQPPELKTAAVAAGIDVLQPASLSDSDAQEAVLAYRPDVLVACAFGLIVPQSLIDRLPAVVVHPSPVPKWRGAAPVERALMAGETGLGVATLLMTAGIDEGPVGDEREVFVPRESDAGQAYDLLAGPATESLVAVLDGIEAGTVVWRPQEGTASYAEKLGKADRRIDRSWPAERIADQVRALSPRTGATTELCDRPVTVWRARPWAKRPEGDPDAGDRLFIDCGEGVLEILEIQEAGRRRMSTAEYLRGAGRRLRQQ